MGLLKIGDSILWRGAWGTAPPREAKVLKIKQFHKNSIVTYHSELDWSIVKDGLTVMVLLSNRVTAYGFQIDHIN